jgi:uncharacterized protein YfbU (UPF0304 family)
MDLTRTERWMLANQYRILEALDPDSANYYEKVREALEEGLAAPIDWYAEHIYAEPHTMSRADCSFVSDVMAMHDALQSSFKHLGGVEGLEPESLRFSGFDGNNETKFMGYARFIIEREERFTYLDRNPDLNSHMPTLEVYERMLAAWGRHEKKHQLTAQQINDILSSRIHPSRRGEQR